MPVIALDRSRRGACLMSRVATLTAALAAVALGTGLTACSGADEPTPSTPASTTPTPGPAAAELAEMPEPDEETDEETMDTPIRIVIDDQILDARLSSSPAAQSLINQLPLTLAFSDYGGQEVLAEPPQPLTMDGMPSGESAPAGTIGYYAPGRAVVLYYADVGRFTGLVRIGQIDGDVSVLRGWAGARSVTIERAD